MSEKKVVASMMPKKKAAPKKKAVAKKKAAVKKKAVKKTVKKSTPAKSLNAPVIVEDPDLGVTTFPKEPKVEMPEEFKRVEHPPMGVKDQDKEAAVFLFVVVVIAAIVGAIALGV